MQAVEGIPPCKHAILPIDYIYIVCLHTFYAFSITSEISPNSPSNNIPQKYRSVSLCETWKFYLEVGLVGPCRGCHGLVGPVVLTASWTSQTVSWWTLSSANLKFIKDFHVLLEKGHISHWQISSSMAKPCMSPLHGAGRWKTFLSGGGGSVWRTLAASLDRKGGKLQSGAWKKHPPARLFLICE